MRRPYTNTGVNRAQTFNRQITSADDELWPPTLGGGKLHQRSALEIFALNGVVLKSESTHTMFARSSATMGLA